MATGEHFARAEDYRDAAGEHLTAAFLLYDNGHFTQAIYLAGLAVECMLRAYRMMTDPAFDSRHDIDKLFELAQFADFVPRPRVEIVTAALGDVVSLWSNDVRYASQNSLRKRWTSRKLFAGIKGDFVKYLTSRLLESAATIVNTGAIRWKSSFPS